MQEQPQFPIGNPAPLGGQVLSASETALVKEYASRILTVRRKVARHTLDMGALIWEAIQKLSPGGQKELAHRIGLSPGTISKYKKIHDARERFEGRLEILPPELSTLYSLACVSPDVYQRMTKNGLIGPNLTAKAIENFVSQCSTGAAPAGSGAGGKLETLAIIKCPPELSVDKRQECLTLVRAALRGGPITVTEPTAAPHSKMKARKELAVTFHQQLTAELAGLCPTDVPPEDYRALENVAWQHQHKRQKGTYPYSPDDPNSIENPNHLYSIHGQFSTSDTYFAHLAERRIITPYSPLAQNPTFSRANCLRLAIDYCEAASKNAREAHFAELEKLRNSDSAGVASSAEECVDRLRRGGAV